MPIAKKALRVGFTIAALPGTYIDKAAVEQYGWQDDVEDGPDIGGAEVGKDADAPKGKAKKEA